MRKWLFVFAFIVGIFIVYLQYREFSRQGRTDHAILEYGESQKFSHAEIQAAMDCVLKEFKSFEGCDLQKLWYDEKISNREYGIDSVKGIVLLSNFYADASVDGGLAPDSEVTEYTWLLVRDRKSTEWILKSSGYA